MFTHRKIHAAILLLFLCMICFSTPSYAARTGATSTPQNVDSNAGDTIRDMRQSARMGIATPWIGLGVKDASQGSGAVVQVVASGSPAEAAGFRIGDVITNVDGKPITNANELIEAVASLKIGSDYPFTVFRDNQSMQITVRPVNRRDVSLGAAGQISDKPAPRKGPTDINVLKYVLIDPQTHMVAFIGKYDPSYDTGPIPYADYLKVAQDHLYPSFSLDPAAETVQSLKQAVQIIDADMKRVSDPDYANQWGQKVANLLLNDPSLELDRQRLFANCANVIGITGDELKRMYDAATGKISIPDTEFMGLAAKMIRGVGLPRAGDALGVLAAGGSPEELMSNMADKLGLTQEYQNLASRSLSLEAFRKEEIILVMSEICREFGAPENEIQGIMSSIRNGQSSSLIIDYMAKQMSNYIINRSGRGMINGLVLGPGVISKLYNLPLPKADLTFKDLPPDSLLGDVFFKSDYRLKSVGTFPDARDRVPDHLTSQEFMARQSNEKMKKELCAANVIMGCRLVPAEVVMQVSPSRDAVEFGQSNIKIIGWIMQWLAQPSNEAINFLNSTVAKYGDFLTDHYDEYAKAYPEWHKLAEAGKIIALARWAKNNGYVLSISNDSGEKVHQPAQIDGFWSAVFEVTDESQYLNFIAEGGASFSRDEGEDWMKLQENVSITSDVQKQLAASAVLAEQSVGSAVSGNLEDARDLAEKSAQAMTGEIDLTKIPSLEGVPMPADPAIYAAVTTEAINEATDCLHKISDAKANLERADQLMATSPDEAEKMRQQATQTQDQAQRRLQEILNEVRDYRSDPSHAGEALVALQRGAGVVTPIGGAAVASNESSSTSAAGTGQTGAQTAVPASMERRINATNPEDLAKLVAELDDVNKHIAATRDVLMKLNVSIQQNHELFMEWQNSASAAFDRCVGMVADAALDFGIGGLVDRYDTIYDLAKKLPGHPEDVIEKYRYLASLTHRMNEANAVNDFADLADRENKTVAEMWETLRDGVGQISGLLQLDKTVPGMWWKYASLAFDAAYNVTDLYQSWKNINTMQMSNQKYAEALKKITDRLEILTKRQKDIEAKIQAGGDAEKLIE